MFEPSYAFQIPNSKFQIPMLETPNLIAAAVEPVVQTAASADDPLWFKDAVIYQAHVKSFFDSNNDGIGDFQGLTQKLDYLQDLGVTCLWLLPFFPSPLRDDGYDIADYLNVHPSYGTLNDFQALVRAAHTRHIQILIELVVNHTSDQHPWFQRARHAPRGSAEREFYVWSDSDKKFSETRIIFLDSEKSNWAYEPVAVGRPHVFRRGRRMSHGVSLPADAADVHGHPAGGSPCDHRNPEPDARNPRQLSVGALPPQSRRAHAGNGDRR